MKTYTIEMTRTYVTYLEYEAKSKEDALLQHLKDQEKYAVELEQCCIADEKSKIIDIQ